MQEISDASNRKIMFDHELSENLVKISFPFPLLRCSRDVVECIPKSIIPCWRRETWFDKRYVCIKTRKKVVLRRGVLRRVQLTTNVYVPPADSGGSSFCCGGTAASSSSTSRSIGTWDDEGFPAA
jgi:hypothetical protein